MIFPTVSREGIARRLAFGFGLIILMLIGVAGWGALELRNSGERLRQIVEIDDRKIEQANLMLHDIDRLAIQVRTLSLTTDPREVESTARALTQTEEDYRKAEASLSEAISTGGSRVDEQKLVDKIKADARRTIPLVDQAAKQGQDGANMDAAVTLTQQVRPSEMAWRDGVRRLIAAESELNGAVYQDALMAQRRTAAISAALVALTVAVASLLAWRITRSVTVPIGEVIRVAARIAEGDLTSSVPSSGGDEVGRLLGSMSLMQHRLSDLVGAIRDSAQSIETASAEVASGNQDLSRRTELTASNLQSTASSMARLTAIAANNDTAAHRADQLSVSASDLAMRGEAAVSKVVLVMGEISESSRRIVDIIGVIDSIAFQTNVLSLNAAVEAARAGERGRGFAVVAAEVRALAERCAAAARETKSLIEASQQRVLAGSQSVHEAGDTMNELLTSVRGASGLIGEIRAASNEHSTSIGTINSSMNSLDQMTQQNAALVEESAAAAESLKIHAVKLADLVMTFRLTRSVDIE